MKQKRVLIGSCGGLTGCYLARRFQKMDNITVIGADVNSCHATKLFLDEFVQLPPVADSDFRDALTDVLVRYRIDYYLPTGYNRIHLCINYQSDMPEQQQHARHA